MKKSVNIKHKITAVIKNPYFIIAAALFLFYGRLLYGGNTVYSGDFFAYQFPEKFLIRNALSHGTLPLMNPYILSGSPMLSNIAAGTLYPLNLLLLIGSPVYGFNLFIFIHLLFAGFAMYLLLRKGIRITPHAALLAALSYALSGPLWGAIDKGFISSAWLISLFFLGIIHLYRCYNMPEASITEKRNAWILSVLSLTLLFYCGNFLEAYTAVLTAGAGIIIFHISVDRERTQLLFRRLASYCSTVMTAVLLAAPQLVPTYLAAGRSYRNGGINLAEAEHWSLPPIRIIEYIIPFFFGTRAGSGFFFGKNAYFAMNSLKRTGDSPWFDSLFAGLPVICGSILAIYAIIKFIAARKSKNTLYDRKEISTAAILFSALIFFFMLAIGRYSFIYASAYYIIPEFNLFRHPEKFAEWINFYLILLGAYGLDKFIEKDNKTLRRILLYLLGVLGLITVILLILFSNEGSKQGLHHVSAFPVKYIYLWRFTFITSSACFLVLMLTALKIFRKYTKRIFYAFMLIAVAQLVSLSYLTEWTVPSATFLNADVWIEKLPDFDRSLWRIFSLPSFKFTIAQTASFKEKKINEYKNLAYNAPALKEIRTPAGFDALMAKGYFNYFNFKKHDPMRLLNLLSVRYIGSGLPAFDETPAGFVRIFPKQVNPSDQRSIILENPDALPRLGLYSQFRLSDANGEENAVFNPKRDIRQNFIIRSLPSNYNAEYKYGKHPKLTIIKDNPGKISLKISGAPIWLVLREWHSPGWKCYDANGNSIPIVTADGGLMAVFIPSADATVTFKYIPPGLYTGFILFLLGIIATGTALIIPCFKKKDSPVH